MAIGVWLSIGLKFTYADWYSHAFGHFYSLLLFSTKDDTNKCGPLYEHNDYSGFVCMGSDLFVRQSAKNLWFALLNPGISG